MDISSIGYARSETTTTNEAAGFTIHIGGAPAPVETLFETKPKKTSSLLQRVGTGEGSYDQLILRGFDGVYTTRDGSLEDILHELMVIALSHAESCGLFPELFDQLEAAISLDEMSDAEFETLRCALHNELLGDFGDDEIMSSADQFDPFMGCDCDECSLERAALNEESR
jgi:hypothetical protein